MGKAKNEIIDLINEIRYHQPDVVYADIQILVYFNRYNVDYPDDLIIREVVV